ncbi:MAG: ABC transporter permease [Acidobacteria bacterium]|nr:ABC transporter permease [Acidobacteriota bacterium]
MNFRRTRAMARKEALHILRDPRSLVLALALPVLMLLLFGYALTLDVDRIPTIVFDRDGSPASRELIARFQGSRYFELVETAGDYRAIERSIDRNSCMLGVVIPGDFSQKLLAGREAGIQLLFDGSDSNTAAIALGYASALLQAYNQEVLAQRGRLAAGGRQAGSVEGRLRIWYNSELKSRNYIVPGLIAVILMIIASLLTSLTIAREWEMGTMEQLLSTPVRPPEIVLGKMSAFFMLGLVDTVIAVGAGVWVFGVPLRGNVLFLLATSCIFLLGALFWGIFLSAAARTQVLAYQMGVLSSFLPAFLLSGFIFAVENMPPVIQVITYIFPARYFVTILKGVFLRGIGMEILAAEVILLAVYAMLVFMFATRKLRQKIA